jgi:hypothetical protein
MLKNQSLLVHLFGLMSVAKSFAQDPLDGPEGPPSSPINDYTFPFVCVAILLGGYFFYKFKKKQVDEFCRFKNDKH